MTLPREISVEELDRMRKAGEPMTLLDVRNHGEYDWAKLMPSVLIPLPELEDRIDEVKDLPQPIVTLCHHGVRSFAASEFLRELGINATSVRGGIDAWSLRVDPSVKRY